MPAPHAQLSVTTPATRAIDAGDGEVPITATGFPGLATVLADADSFDMPEAGRLRCTAGFGARYAIQATVSAEIDGAARNFDLRLAKNGVAIAASESRLALADLFGLRSASIHASADLVSGDFVEVVVEASGAANLSVEDLSLGVEAASVTPATGLVSEADLRAFARFIPSNAEVLSDLAASRALMAKHLDSAGLDTSLAYQIELRMAAHFAALRFPDGRRTSEREGDIASAYGGKLGRGLEATFFGQDAILLDWTNTLRSLDSSRIAAEIHVGGLSKSTKLDAEKDSDRVQPSFKRGQDDFTSRRDDFGDCL